MGKGVVADTEWVADTARTEGDDVGGDDAGSAEAGSVGGAGVTGGGESGTASSCASDIERGEASDGVVGDGDDGDAFDGGVAGQDKGERSKSLSSSKSRRSSTSFRRFGSLGWNW
jgi:hypothetical protein